MRRRVTLGGFGLCVFLQLSPSGGYDLRGESAMSSASGGGDSENLYAGMLTVQSTLSQSTAESATEGFGNGPLSAATEFSEDGPVWKRARVGKDDRRLATVGDAVDAFNDYLADKEGRKVILECTGTPDVTASMSPSAPDHDGEGEGLGDASVASNDDMDRPFISGPTEGAGVVPGSDSGGTGSNGTYSSDDDGGSDERVVSEGDTIALDYEHRWMSRYRRETYAKIEAMEQHVKRHYGESVPTTLVTLTAGQSDRDGNPLPPASVMEDMREGWSKLRKQISRKTSGYDSEYIKVWEPHESGYPHLHVVIVGAYLKTLEDDIRRLWCERYDIGEPWAQDVNARLNEQESALDAVGYALKYIKKGFPKDEDDIRASDRVERAHNRIPEKPGMDVFHSMLWALDIRQYSASQGFTQAAARDSPDTGYSWEYRGMLLDPDLPAGLYSGNDADELLRLCKEGSASGEEPAAEAVGEVAIQSGLIRDRFSLTNWGES